MDMLLVPVAVQFRGRHHETSEWVPHPQATHCSGAGHTLRKDSGVLYFALPGTIVLDRAILIELQRRGVHAHHQIFQTKCTAC
jgi:hypothetical protein